MTVLSPTEVTLLIEALDEWTKAAKSNGVGKAILVALSARSGIPPKEIEDAMAKTDAEQEAKFQSRRTTAIRLQAKLLTISQEADDAMSHAVSGGISATT